MAYTAEQIKALHAKLDAALKEFADENGLVAGSSRIKYGTTDFQVQVQFGDKAANPDEIDPRYLRDLTRNGAMYGLSAKMIGTPLILAGRAGRVNFKFVGMRASKAVCINKADGKPYLWDATFIAHQIALQAKA